MNDHLARALEQLRVERDHNHTRCAALAAAIDALQALDDVPLVNPADTPPGRPIVIPNPAPSPAPDVERPAVAPLRPAATTTSEHVCPECDLSFGRPNGLSRHLNQTHGIITRSKAEAKREANLAYRAKKKTPKTSPAAVEPDHADNDPDHADNDPDHADNDPDERRYRCDACTWNSAAVPMAAVRLARHTRSVHQREIRPHERRARTLSQLYDQAG